MRRHETRGINYVSSYSSHIVKNKSNMLQTARAEVRIAGPRRGRTARSTLRRDDVGSAPPPVLVPNCRVRLPPVERVLAPLRAPAPALALACADPVVVRAAVRNAAMPLEPLIV